MFLLYLCENFPETCIQERDYSVLFQILSQMVFQAITSLFLTVEKEQRKCPGITYSAQGYSAELGFEPIFFWSSHLTFSWEASRCRRERNPEQKWHWQNSETEGSVKVCTNILESSPLPQMKYLPLQPLIILKVSRSKFHRDNWTHHREDEKDLMAWASSLKDTLPKNPNPLLCWNVFPICSFIRFQH